MMIDELKVNEMVAAWTTVGREEKCIQDFCGEVRVKENHLGVGDRMILKFILKT